MDICYWLLLDVVIHI